MGIENTEQFTYILTKIGMSGEFVQPISGELLELEDEMGDAARALKVMKSEINEAVVTIKRCIDYMNNQIEDLTYSRC